MNGAISLRRNPMDGTYRQFGIRSTIEELDSILGPENRVPDDPYKVTVSWGVIDERGRELSVWDWKGSAAVGMFSGWGSRSLAEELGLNIE